MLLSLLDFSGQVENLFLVFELYAPKLYETDRKVFLEEASFTFFFLSLFLH